MGGLGRAGGTQLSGDMLGYETTRSHVYVARGVRAWAAFSHWATVDEVTPSCDERVLPEAEPGLLLPVGQLDDLVHLSLQKGAYWC